MIILTALPHVVSLMLMYYLVMFIMVGGSMPLAPSIFGKGTYDPLSIYFTDGTGVKFVMIWIFIHLFCLLRIWKLWTNGRLSRDVQVG